MLERINLVPQLPLAERIRKITLPAVGLLLVLIILFLSASDRIFKAKISSLNLDIAAAQQRAGEIAATQAKIAQLTSSIKQQKEEKEQLSAQAAKLTSIQERKKYFSRVLATITTALPSSVRCDKSPLPRMAARLPAAPSSIGNYPPL